MLMWIIYVFLLGVNSDIIKSSNLLQMKCFQFCEDGYAKGPVCPVYEVCKKQEWAPFQAGCWEAQEPVGVLLVQWKRLLKLVWSLLMKSQGPVDLHPVQNKFRLNHWSKHI